MSDISKKLISLASLGIILCSSSISRATTEQTPTPGNPKLVVEGANASLNQVGEWEVMVDTDKKTITTRQLSGLPGIKVAGILGPTSGVSAPQLGSTVFNNTNLVTTGTAGNTFASASMQFTITNNTGATLGEVKPIPAPGQPTPPTGVTGVRLMMPYTATECTTGATTLQRPICVVTNTSTKVSTTGLSGRNDGTDPVYLAYPTPRDGSNLSAADDASPVELNEATGFTSATDYARTIWQPTLTIPNGQTKTFGLRFRYAQDATGTGQARVTRFLYKFRVEATSSNGAAITPTNAYVTTLAGNGTTTFNDGTGRVAQFNVPSSVAVSPDGKTLYVTDQGNHRIRQIDVATKNVTTLAGSTQGSTDGTGTAALFNNPSGVAVSPDGTTVYVAELTTHRIRQIDVATKAVTTLAGSTQGSTDGTGTAAQFNAPRGVAVSPDGKTLYVADQSNHRIRQIDVATKVVTTLAGQTTGGFTDGTGTAAQFNAPRGVAVSPDGKTLYVADQSNHIRQIDVATKVVTTLAGQTTGGFQDGTGTAAQFNAPRSVAVSPDSKTLYVADSTNHGIRQIDVATKNVTTLAGNGTSAFNDGTGTAARFRNPSSLAVSPDDKTLYVADQTNNRIRMIQATEGQ